MTKFFIGLDHPNVAWPFLRVMISANALRRRQSGFRVNEWILDSGAFSQISHHGCFIITPDQYLVLIDRFQPTLAVAQDWMCEPMILAKTGLSITEHQDRTVESYAFLGARSSSPILPVLQGFEPSDYVRHILAYGNLLAAGALVGVGSVCKRNGNPDAIEDVLLAIKTCRPDLRLHGFGLKVQAIKRATIRALLESSDSMAWTYAGRRQMDVAGHDPRRALRYAAQIEELIGHPVFIQPQLAQWWAA